MMEATCFSEILDYLNRSGVQVFYTESPRMADRLFMQDRLRLQIVETERSEGRSLWRWRVSIKGSFNLEGNHWTRTALNAQAVLTVIARNVSNPDNRNGPEMWIDAWERRILWAELEDMRREVMKHIEGPVRSLN
jgi:hypothetical protein